MRRRVVRMAVAAGVSVTSLTGVLATPAWAPKVHTVPAGLTVESCRDGGWDTTWHYSNQGQCISVARGGGR